MWEDMDVTSHHLVKVETLLRPGQHSRPRLGEEHAIGCLVPAAIDLCNICNNGLRLRSMYVFLLFMKIIYEIHPRIYQE